MTSTWPWYEEKITSTRPWYEAQNYLNATMIWSTQWPQHDHDMKHKMTSTRPSPQKASGAGLKHQLWDLDLRFALTCSLMGIWRTNTFVEIMIFLCLTMGCQKESILPINQVICQQKQRKSDVVSTQDFDLGEMEEKSKNGRELGEFRLTGHLGAWWEYLVVELVAVIWKLGDIRNYNILTLGVITGDEKKYCNNYSSLTHNRSQVLPGPKKGPSESPSFWSTFWCANSTKCDF